jgi:predicted O-methyltransferase YrrM
MKLPITLFEEMQDYAAKYHVPIISMEGAELLVRTVTNSKPLSILEIGTAIGYSTLKIAESMPDDAKIVTIELDPERVETARFFIKQSGAEDRIQLLTGDAGGILSNLNEIFDLVFIDAAKGQYLDYFKKIETKLSYRAVVIADNVLFRGYVDSDAVPPRRYRTIVKRLREYLQYVSNHPHFETNLFRIGDGVAISYHRGTQCE